MKQNDLTLSAKKPETPSSRDPAWRNLLAAVLTDQASMMARFSDEFGIGLSSLFHHSLCIHNTGDVVPVIERLVRHADTKRLLKLADDIRMHQLGILGALDQIGRQVLSQLESDDPAGEGLFRHNRSLKQRIEFYSRNIEARQREMVIPGFVIGYRSSRERARQSIRSRS